MSSGTSTPTPPVNTAGTKLPPTLRLCFWAILAFSAYAAFDGRKFVPFFWAVNHSAGTPSAWIANFWPLPLAVVGFIAYFGAARIKSNKPRRQSPDLGFWLVLRSVYEETTRWLLGTFWTVIIFTFPGAFAWLFSWSVPVVNLATFGMLGHHPGTHSWMIGAVAILAAVPVFWTRAFGQANRAGNWYIGVVMYAVMMSFGLFVAIGMRLLLHVLIVITRRFMDARQCPAPAPTTNP